MLKTFLNKNNLLKFQGCNDVFGNSLRNDLKKCLEKRNSSLTNEPITDIEDSEYNSEISSSKTKYNTYTVNVYLDTEYQLNKSSTKTGCSYTDISIQLVIEHRQSKKFQKLIVINEQFKSFIPSEVIDDFIEKDVKIFFKSFNSDDFILLDCVTEFLEENRIYEDNGLKDCVLLNIYYFYMIRDLTIALGYNNLEPYFLKNKGVLTNYKILKGFFKFTYNVSRTEYLFIITPKDLSALQVGSLLDLAKSCGIEMAEKSLMDNYKSRMVDGLKNHPKDFINYAMQDALVLPQILQSKVESYNSIMEDISIPASKYFTKITLPLTLGSTVNNIFVKHLDNVFSRIKDLDLAFVKQSILNPLNPDYFYYNKLHLMLQAVNSPNSLESFKSSLTILDRQYLNKLISDKYAFKEMIYEAASVRRIASNSNNNTLGYLTLRTGGRSNNESPEEYLSHYCVDVDIAQAYGTRLLKTIYPIGKPTFISYTPNQDVTSRNFKDVLSLIEAKTKQHSLYKIVVSGKLSFEQDLLLSKICNNSGVTSLATKANPMVPSSVELPTDTVILRKELVNATITAPIVEVLRKVCSTKELSEIYSLTVISAVYYDEDYMVASLDELKQKLLYEVSDYQYSSETNSVIDNRCLYWYPLPLETFVKPLYDTRKKLKSFTDILSKAKSNAIKAIINSLYGVITSVYFETGNIVVSDLITSSVRVSVWLMAKALRLKLTITDGSFFEVNKVNFIKKSPNPLKKPSLNTLSNYRYMDNHNTCITGPLGNKSNWVDLFESKSNPETWNLDKLMQDHVVQFWDFYKIKFTDILEAKIDHTAIKAVHFLKAHYLMQAWDKDKQDYVNLVTKIRGVGKRDLANKVVVNPIYHLMQAMLNGEERFQFNYFYQSTAFFSLRQFMSNLIPDYLNKDKKQRKSYAIYKPGDFIYKTSEFRLNNTHCHIRDLYDYNKRKNRSSSKVTYEFANSKIRALLYEAFFFTHSISEVVSMLNNNHLVKSNTNLMQHAIEQIEELNAYCNNFPIETVPYGRIGYEIDSSDEEEHFEDDV